jgi:ArsR family transcriptional regulator
MKNVSEYRGDDAVQADAHAVGRTPQSLDAVLAVLRAISEETRYRILILCAEADLTVSELTRILGQSQPRVSRHLKVLCDAGLLERIPEGSWMFYRLSHARGQDARLKALLRLYPADDSILDTDHQRLQTVWQDRQAAATAYFKQNVAQWDALRSLHTPDAQLKAALLHAVDGVSGDVLDVGTGTGTVLQWLAPQCREAIGIDISHDMLAYARVSLQKAGLANVMVRQGDMYVLPFESCRFDLVTLNMILHYADRPQTALAEAARVLQPGGQVVVTDFLSHGLEQLRTEHNHRRLGFSDEDIGHWCQQVGLQMQPGIPLQGPTLTTCIWVARKPAV